MKFFRSIQENFAIIGINSHQSIQKCPLNVRNAVCLLLFLLSLISSIAYVLCEAKNFAEYSNAAFSISGATFCSATMATLIWMMPKLFTFVTDIENIANKRSAKSTPKSIYLEVNEQIEQKFKRISVYVVKVWPLCNVLPTFILSFVTYFTTDSGPDAFELPLPMYFPFNWKSPMGYVIAALFEYISALICTFFAACVSTFVIGGSMVIKSVIKDLKNIIKSLNKYIGAKKSSKACWAKVSEFIDIHTGAKQLVRDFSAVYRQIFVYTILWSIIAICETMLALRLELAKHSPDSTVLIILIGEMILSFVIILIFCEVGHRVSIMFVELDYEIGQTKWYSMSLKIQQILKTVTIAVQQPVILDGFGSIVGSRTVFQQVVSKAFSTFLVLMKLY